MAGEPLGTTYYPSCVVNLLIRFDEDLIARWKSGAFVQEQPASSAEIARGTPASLVDAQQPGSSLIGRIPKSARVELPGIRKPGTFHLTFDYRDLPIDPRLVRSVGVEIFLDTVTPANFAAGVVGTPGAPQARVSQLTAAQRISAVKQTADNLVLKGLVDSWQVNHGTRGSEVTIEGRDLVGLFLDTPLTAPLLAKLQLNNRIDVVIRQIVSSIEDWNKNLDVVAADANLWPKGEVPFLANIDRLNPSMPRVRVSAKAEEDKAKPRKSIGADQDKLSFWDLVTRYCNLVAAVPYFTMRPKDTTNPQLGYKSTIVIAPQWGLYDYLNQGRAPSPFKPERQGVGKIRKLMYGRNIEELSLERKFQGITARAVEVVSYNPSSKAKGESRLLSTTSTLTKTYAERQAGTTPALARDPEGANRSSVSPSGLSAKDTVLRISVKGISDPEQLQILADGLYEEIMRGETGGSVRTRSLASFGGGNEDPDLIHIRPRDAIVLAVDARPLGTRAPNVNSPLVQEARLDTAALEEEIFKRTGDRTLAAAIVAAGRSGAFRPQNTFRVNAVKFDWDIGSGISISLDFHNYIMARNAIKDTPPAETAQPSGGKATAAGGTGRRR